MAAAPDFQVGVLAKRGRFAVVEPLFEQGRRIPIDFRRNRDVSIGDIVLVRSDQRGGRTRAKIVRTIGRPDVARDVVEALLFDSGHHREFSQAVLGEAQAIAAAGEQQRRADLTAKPTFTIDPASARDFDDAISIERDGDNVRLYIHIADVAAFVAPGTAIDAEALRRANSVYVPGAVEPMLPAELSNDACSLVPGKPRRTFTVEMTLGQSGLASAASFYRSTINSDVRMTYEQVDEVFAGRGQTPEPIAEELRLARRLAATIRARRFERGALTLETSEPEFEFDGDGHVRECRDEIQTEAHWLIEEFMILANEQVAAQLERRRDPTIYRVHERPDPKSIEFLVKQLESLGVPTPSMPEHLTPAQATEATGRISRLVTDFAAAKGHRTSALTSLVLRSLKQAVYSTRNIGHSGLASPAYCHFTSPIRRYPDLVVHRSLLAAFEGDPVQAGARELEQTAEHCSTIEREAAKVEHIADDICQAFLLETMLFEQGWDKHFDGEVNGLTHGAAFVTFGELPGGSSCEGFLPARKLRDDWYDLNEEQTALVGRDSGKTVRIGDPVVVTVRSVDPPRGRVDLDPVEPKQ